MEEMYRGNKHEAGRSAMHWSLLKAVTVTALLVAVQACGSSNVTPSAPGGSPTESPTPVDSPSPSATALPSSTTALATVYADLDGVLTTAALAHRQPIAVMIDD